MEKLISVIIPVYNVAPYLKRCLNSVLGGSYRNLEVICVDDGSTDESGKFCDAYAQQDSRVRVIHKQNGGLSSARNVGMDVATGEYMAFIDSDDWVHERYFEILAEKLENTKADIAICGYVTTKENAQCFGADLTAQPRIMTARQAMASHTTKSYAWGKLFRRELIGTARFSEELKIEDAPFNADLLCANLGAKVVFLPIQLYAYFQRSGSLMGKLRACDYEVLSKHYYSCGIAASSREERSIWAVECVKTGMAACRRYEWQKEPEKAEAALHAARKAVRLLGPLQQVVYGILTIPGVYRVMIAFKER